MKLLAFFLVFLLILSITAMDASALSKAEKAKQLKEREAALKNIPKNQTVIKPVDNKIMTIELSKSCLALVKSNSNRDGCYRYSALEILDTTNKKYSGSFVYDNGFYHRGKPMITNHDIVYKNSNQTVICVDCPPMKKFSGKSIIVEPRNFVYTANSDKLLNNTRYEYHDRYVSNCQVARVSSDMDLIKDTIEYLKSGCRTTSFNEKVTIVKPYSKLDYDGPYYQYLKWLSAAKNLKGINCLKSDLC